MLRVLLFILLFPVASFAQFSYTLDQSIPVDTPDGTLSMPWAGGLNSPQVNRIDFDGDGKEDIVVFDRSAGKLLPYRNNNNKYEYAPDYETSFPDKVNAWLLLRDFNCDGKKDLFTSDPFGIIVFVNITKPGQPLAWREFNPGFPLLTKGFSGNINLKINDVDIPGIDDVDGDGDLDILAMRFVGIGTIEWHKNMSIENTGKCDSLQLERITQNYGTVQECTCGSFTFGNTPCPNVGRTQHVGGKSLLSLDIDNDGDKDLLYSEESCAAMYLFKNEGTKDEALFTTAVLYPTTKPAAFPLFPTPYYEDVDFDGLKDLVVAPNLYARSDQNTIVKNSVWLYKNTGTPEVPAFTFTTNSFLQENMIDVGDYSAPAFYDVDFDGDEDMFVGFYGDNKFRGSLYYFENTGTASLPRFNLVSTDYGGITGLGVYYVRPQFVDMNGDGKVDLAIAAAPLTQSLSSLLYIPNTADKGFTPDFGNAAATRVNVGPLENIYVTDVNLDGKPDLLIGRSTGSLDYVENQGDNNGLFDRMVVKNSSFLGLGSSTSRQTPAVAVGDLDADGFEDIVVGDQKGNLSFYGDYRNFDPALSSGQTAVVFNAITKEYESRNFAGKARPAITNLFNANRPAVVVGNNLGGLFVLRNDNASELPPDPVVTIWNNPVDRSKDEPLHIRADRNARVQIFSILGQKMNESVFIPANQDYQLTLKELAAGMYIARFSFTSQNVTLKFVIK